MRITILIFLFTTITFSQNRRTDIGGGTFDKLKTPMLILGNIEKNRVVDIKKHLINPNEFDMLEWTKYCRKIAYEFPNNNNSLPSTNIKSDENLWYERIYYNKDNGEINYLLQVHFDLLEINDTIKIKNIQFREGQNIVKRDKEFKRLNDNSIPPPPPALTPR